MVKKRVKVKPEVVKVVEDKPKVRAKAPKTATKKIEKVLSEMVPTEKNENKKIKSDNSFERHKAFGDLLKRTEITDKVKNGQLKWSFYAIDGENGYHYYLKIKK
jgi:hypothetical protein